MKLLFLSSVVSLLVCATPAMAELYHGPIYQNGKVWVPMDGGPEDGDLGFGHWEVAPNNKALEKLHNKELKGVKKALDKATVKE